MPIALRCWIRPPVASCQDCDVSPSDFFEILHCISSCGVFYSSYKTPSPACSTTGGMNLVQKSRLLSDFLSGESINSFGKFVRPQRNQTNQTDQTDQIDQKNQRPCDQKFPAWTTSSMLLMSSQCPTV